MTSDCKTRRSVSIAACFCCLVLAAGIVRAAEADESSAPHAEPREFFEKHVRPLLAAHCYECHSGDAKTLQAGLRLDGRQHLLLGGDSGPAVVPGEPDESLLISAVRYETFEMPPRGKLSDEQVATLERWIADGAWWPPEEATPGGDNRATAFDWRARRAAHWAWQPVSDPQPPTIPTESELDPIDAFILDRLGAASLKPAPPAQPHHLVRRLYLDLIGLPPTPQQVQEFTSAPTDENYRQLVDRLLASPQFGEKWARHWLDLVRYAETCGHEFDYPIPHAHGYRDYVIRALNADVPYDQFVREHIAGDLLPEPRRHPITGTNESIIGTGFWFLGEAVHAPTDVRADEADRIDNQLDVFGKTFLAMTIACARCHDHKFDPIPTSDYYALAGFLQSSRRQLAMLDPFDRIARTTELIAERRGEGDRRLQSAVARATPVLADHFADWLLAAATRRRTSGATADAGGALTASSKHDDSAARSSLESVIERMAAALDDEALASPEHPLHVWHVLSNAPTVNDFETRRAELAGRLQAQDDAHRQALAQMVRFADFRTSGFDDWFVTGGAFGRGATIGGQWDGPATAPQFARPFVAHSGRVGGRQYGVLRSPTFTLEHERIHYRLLAENVQLRLIVDGYVMDTYNALLFEDITLEQVDTGGRMRWVSQQKDLNHYLGHRAHLEIIDHGNGFAAVEGIYFSNTDPPPEAVHPWNLAMVLRPGLHSPADLSAAYGELFQQAAANGPSLSEEWTELWNWLLRWELIELPDNWSALADDVARLQDSLAKPELVQAMADGTDENERLHIRGNPRNLGPEIARRPPTIFGDDSDFVVSAGSGRRELAERLTAPDNPLLARVAVNRLWHHLMGRGLVATVDDFGVMGQPPTHPELLDWLARDMMQHRWSLKHVIRRIVLSRTYRQATRSDDPAAAEADPENLLWHRARLRRLTAEQLRDAMLDISGRLDPEMYGRSVPVHLTDFMTGRGRPRSGPLDGDGRRSIYVRVQRNFLSPMMLAFDMPAPFSTMGRRSSSNVPAQSLIMMNDPFVWQQASLWAEQLGRATNDRERRIELAYLQALSRPPRPEERTMLLQFIESQAALRDQSDDSLDVWTDVCHAIWNMKEFLYIF